MDRGGDRPLPREVTIEKPANPRVNSASGSAVTGDARFIAFERNIDYQMSENLKQPEATGTRGPDRRRGEVRWPAHVYDLHEKRLGETDRIAFGSTPGPSLFAVLERMPEGRVVERFGAVVDRPARPHTPPCAARPGVAGGLITPGRSIVWTDSAQSAHAPP